MRWNTADGRNVPAGHFIPLLYDVVRDPDYLELKISLRKQLLTQLAAFPDLYVSFNFRLEQLAFEGSAQMIGQSLKDIMDHPGRRIVIELAESALDDRTDISVLLRELQALRQAGFRIALDDFGVAASNLQRLQEFPVDIVKIDRSLIMRLETSRRQRTTLRSIATMLEELGIAVIVEGVEIPAQAAALKKMGLTVQQGFLHARPMPPEDVAASFLPQEAEALTQR